MVLLRGKSPLRGKSAVRLSHHRLGGQCEQRFSPSPLGFRCEWIQQLCSKLPATMPPKIRFVLEVFKTIQVVKQCYFSKVCSRYHGMFTGMQSFFEVYVGDGCIYDQITTSNLNTFTSTFQPQGKMSKVNNVNTLNFPKSTTLSSM